MNSDTENYAYDDADKLTSVSVGGSITKAYGYDSCGRTTSIVTSAGTTTFAYDYESRVTSLYKPGSGTETYSYNGLDTRVGSSGQGGSKTFRRDGVGVTAPVLSDGSRTFTPGISSRSGSTSTFDVSDYLGSTARQTNSSQSTTATRTYDVFGNLTATTGSPVPDFAKGSPPTVDGSSPPRLTHGTCCESPRRLRAVPQEHQNLTRPYAPRVHRTQVEANGF